MKDRNVRKFLCFFVGRTVSTFEYSCKLPGLAPRTTRCVWRAAWNQQSNISDDTLIAISSCYTRRELALLKRRLHLYSDAISILREPADEWRVNDTCPRTSRPFVSLPCLATSTTSLVAGQKLIRLPCFFYGYTSHPFL